MSQKKEQLHRLEFLDKKLIELTQQNINNADDQLNRVNQEILNCEKERNEIVSYRTQGAMVRCKADWLHYGQKMGKYLFALERHRYNKKNSMPHLK